MIIYADDVVILGRIRHVIEEGYVTLKREARSVGLEINVRKTKHMVIEGTRQIHPPYYNIGGEKIDLVSAFP